MLSAHSIEQFHHRGYLLSGAAGSLAHDLPDRDTFARVLATPGKAPDPAVDRHLDDPVTYALCTHPQILERVAALLGPDLLLWHSRYFDKPAGGPPIPWHQDAPFWSMQPTNCVSAWVALEDVHPGNGCVEVVPGSNSTPLPRVPSTGTGRFHYRADVTGVEVGAAIHLPLPRGEFFLFHQWLLHRSSSNPGAGSRLALAIQYIPPDVQLGLERPRRRIPDFGVLLVRGEDRLRLNPHARPPVG